MSLISVATVEWKGSRASFSEDLESLAESPFLKVFVLNSVLGVAWQPPASVRRPN